jgi:anti-anti-sigma factor
MTTGRADDGQGLIEHARELRATSRRIHRRAAAARACFAPPPSPAAQPCARLRPGVGYVVVEAVGSVDLANRHELDAVLVEAVDSGVPHVVVDLTAVTLLSAAAYHCLERALVALSRRGGRLHVVCAADGVAARVLRVVEPHPRWSSHVELAAALAAAVST